MAEVKDSFGNPLEVGDTVRVTARRGGSNRYADRQITRRVLDIRNGKLVMFDSGQRTREFDPNDVTKLDENGEPLIRWNG